MKKTLILLALLALTVSIVVAGPLMAKRNRVTCSDVDINNDTSIDQKDLGVLLSNFGRTDCNSEKTWCDGADINKDSRVDLKDLKLLLKWFGRDCITVTSVR